jgi:hypothetical protein
MRLLVGLVEDMSLKQGCMRSGCGTMHASSGEAPPKFCGGSAIDSTRIAQDRDVISALLCRFVAIVPDSLELGAAIKPAMLQLRC